LILTHAETPIKQAEEWDILGDCPPIGTAI